LGSLRGWPCGRGRHRPTRHGRAAACSKRCRAGMSGGIMRPTIPASVGMRCSLPRNTVESCSRAMSRSIRLRRGIGKIKPLFTRAPSSVSPSLAHGPLGVPLSPPPRQRRGSTGGGLAGRTPGCRRLPPGSRDWKRNRDQVGGADVHMVWDRITSQQVYATIPVLHSRIIQLLPGHFYVC
jgi:hypothetical protein